MSGAASGFAGSLTGLRGVDLKGVTVFILDSREAYDELVKSLDGTVGEEFEGLAGVRSAIVEGGEFRVAALIVPPFPAPVFEAAYEAVMFGGRRIVAVTQGYRVKRSIPPPKVGIVVSAAAVGLDSVSPRLAPGKLPLVADEALLRAVESADQGPEGARVAFQGYTVTVDSARLLAGDQVVQEYIRARLVAAVDTVTAPIYALRHVYPSLEPLSIVVLRRSWSTAAEPLEAAREAPEETGRAVGERLRAAVRLALRALEALEVGGSG